MPSTPPNEADDIIDNMEVRELRQRLKEMRDEMIVQKEKSLAELELAQRTNNFTPVPVTNLMANINAAAPMDAQQITALVTTLVSAMKTELLSLMEARLDQMDTRLTTVLQHHSTQQSTTSPILPAVPSGSQVSSGQQAVFSPPGSTQPPQGTPASTPTGGSNTSTTNVLNEYDKAVEVDQRKLRNPELTPIALRKWKLAYNIYASDPHKRMKMSEAFGEESLRCLGLMYSDQNVPLDDAGFDAYLNTKFLKSAHLFSDIKTAVSKIKMVTPMSVESLQAYHSSFCMALIPLLDEIQLQTTSQDLHVTLIKAFYDGIPGSFAFKLRETSCSTWMAAQNNFRDCLTKSNVQLAVAHATKTAENNKDKKYDNVEGKRALTVKSRMPQISKTPPKREPVPAPPKALDTGQPYMGKLCSNCRGKHLSLIHISEPTRPY